MDGREGTGFHATCLKTESLQSGTARSGLSGMSKSVQIRRRKKYLNLQASSDSPNQFVCLLGLVSLFPSSCFVTVHSLASLHTLTLSTA